MARSVIKRSNWAHMLRANGFRPIPMLWVKEEQFLRILETAGECKPEYDALRRMYERGVTYEPLPREELEPLPDRPLTREEEIERAWRLRSG